jgi:hypothetical protein
MSDEDVFEHGCGIGSPVTQESAKHQRGSTGQLTLDSYATDCPPERRYAEETSA